VIAEILLAIDTGQLRPVIAEALPLARDRQQGYSARHAHRELAGRARWPLAGAHHRVHRAASAASAELYRESPADAQVPVHPAALER
jgi:hypothetical protein